MVPKLRKRVDVDPMTMKRGPDGSAFLTCESCNTSVPVALAGIHSCDNDAAFKANLAKMRAEHMENHQAEKDTNTKQTRKNKKETKKKETKSSKKAAKDPNEPKRPLSAYMIFLEDFRKQYKQENPESKGVTEAAKAAGSKWRSMTDEDKAPYVAEKTKRDEAYATKLAEFRGEEQPAEKSEVVEEDDATSDGTTTKKKRRLAEKTVEWAEVVVENELKDEL